MNKSQYKKYAENKAKKSNLLADCFNAFWVGGLICTIGQVFKNLYAMWGANEEINKMLIPTTLVFIAVWLTGFGIFDKIAKFAGAGTLVPITGFANAVVSPAIDTTAEGLVLGVGAKIFTIAGPVILYGTLSSALYGLIYYIVTLFMR